VLGRRHDEVFLKRKTLLEPFGVTTYYRDYGGAYLRLRGADQHQQGKRPTQHIERTPLTLRTRIKRLVRKTMGFSQSIEKHNMVIGLYVHRSACGRRV
jgi:insertion element IS1 protein InsB